ncbi:hypothetical protein F0562_004034 [Nyssa sinensis]|uniref:Uncharacterized protein n=1 Tax=Nyssa sinensis TaxID=561372 RepID=A0A5J5BX34_9ASTE|nr:hypothetical protein F0562_004034 [Nyssa sinensis]
MRLKEEISKKSFTTLTGNDFNSLNQPNKRSLLSLPDEHNSFLVAALDGTIYLMEPKSRKTLWSFTSGPSIYSSYQAPIKHHNDKENTSEPGGSFFIDCGDDWELYMHNKLGKVKLQMSVEDFLRITPQSSNEEMNDLYTTIEERGEFGSRNLKTDELPIYIMRTDYSLKSFDKKSGTVLWNMTVAEIGAAFLCQDVEDSFSGAFSDSGYELPSEPGAHFNMPLPCQSKAVVFRFRNHNMLRIFP